MIEGGCFCKKVRYRITEGDYLSVNCHCSMCRRIHAAPYVTWLVVPVEKFEYVAAEPRQLNSSASGARYFCDSCGTQVACMNTEHPDIIDIPVGSLDEPARFPPTRKIFADDKLGWVGDL